MEKDFDITPYFFSHAGENSEEFKELLLNSFNDFIKWRKKFHPEDMDVSSGVDNDSNKYKEGINRFHKYYNEMLERLHSSIPFHSPRYIAHMQSEKLFPGLIGYFTGMLYNLNNVSYEASPNTIQMEYEVAQDLATMIGYDKNKSWGHLTGGGTVANIEALWVVRNIKYFPLIAQDICKNFHKDFEIVQPNSHKIKLTTLSEYELLSLSPDSISNLFDNFCKTDWQRNIYQDIFVNQQNISHTGMKDFYNGKILVAATKHYSWPKAAEILGFGRKNVVLVDVDENMRMDINDLKNKLIQCVENREPIMAVVAIMGATESSSIDYIDKIQEVRNWLEKQYNVSFFLHIDAAYGGYVKSLFLDKNNKIKPYNEVKKYIGTNWPSKEIYNSYCAMKYADSVTVDPHKLGYLPYPAGAIIYKNKITKSATISHAPYISSATKPESEDLYFGEYILEGSKSGAAAAACWLAHKVLPLNDFGYGKFLKNEIIDARYLMNLFNKTFPKQINGKKISIQFFNQADIDILLYAFNYEGNTDIDKFNDFNKKILNQICFDTHISLNKHNYMAVSTSLDYKTYKNSINANLEQLGLNTDKWINRFSNIELFRSAIMNVNLYTEELKEYYYKGFVDEFVKVIGEVIIENNL